MARVSLSRRTARRAAVLLAALTALAALAAGVGALPAGAAPAPSPASPAGASGSNTGGAGAPAGAAAGQGAAGAAAAKGATGGNVLKDRVLAVVDDDPILASDLDRAIFAGQFQKQPAEADSAFRRRVLQDLVAQRLRFHEIDRFGMEQVPVVQIEKQVAEVRARYKDEAAFKQRLKEVGLDDATLHQMMARQLEVLAFVDERLGPQVFVGLDDIATYYRNVLTPQLQKQHLAVPPLDDVRDQIRGVLRQQRLTEEIDRWTEELRAKANIAVYFDRPNGGPLPPVVKRLELGKQPVAPPIPPDPHKPPDSHKPADPQKPPPG